MSDQLVNPDLHVILIHFPIAMLFAGTFIELLAPLFWRQSSFRVAGRWMILVGALASIPAVTSGLFAARQAMGHPELMLAELREHSNLSAEQWGHLRQHIILNSVAAGLLALLVVSWLGSSDALRKTGHPVFVVVLLAAVGAVGAGAWHGGEMVYTHSTGIGLITKHQSSTQQAETHEESTPSTNPSEDKSKMAFKMLNAAGTKLAKVDDVVDLHAVLAGWTVALALGALGMSFRVISVHRALATEDSMASDDDILHALSGRSGGERSSLMGGERSAAPATVAPRPGVARFWLLTTLLTILTAVLGWMIVAPESLQDVIGTFQSEVRCRAHIIAGVSIVVLSLLLALVTRFAPRNRLLVGGFALLLTLAIAAQVWFGVLLIFDSSSGTLTHFSSISQ